MKRRKPRIVSPMLRINGTLLPLSWITKHKRAMTTGWQLTHWDSWNQGDNKPLRVVDRNGELVHESLLEWMQGLARTWYLRITVRWVKHDGEEVWEEAELTQPNVVINDLETVFKNTRQELLDEVNQRTDLVRILDVGWYAETLD